MKHLCLTPKYLLSLLLGNVYDDEVKVLLRSKNILIFSSDFETLFTKQSPCEILGLNFEQKTVYLNYNFPI